MKTKDKIAELARRHSVGIVLGRHLGGVFLVVPEPAAGQDPPLVQAAADLAPGLVELRPDTLAARLGMDADIRSVEGVGHRIVVGEETAVGDPGPGMVAERVPAQVDQQAGHSPDDFSFSDRHELALGEDPLVTAQMRLAPDHILISQDRVSLLVQFDQVGDVIEGRLPDSDGRFPFLHPATVDSGRAENKASFSLPAASTRGLHVDRRPVASCFLRIHDSTNPSRYQ